MGGHVQWGDTSSEGTCPGCPVVADVKTDSALVVDLNVNDSSGGAGWSDPLSSWSSGVLINPPGICSLLEGGPLGAPFVPEDLITMICSQLVDKTHIILKANRAQKGPD